MTQTQQEQVVQLGLLMLYRGLRSCTMVDPCVRREFFSLPADLVIEIGVAGSSCGVILARQQGKLLRLKCQPFTHHRLQVFIKSPDAAWKLIWGQRSLEEAFVRGDLLLCGQVSYAMSLVRCLHRVQHYLMPQRVLGRLEQLPRASEGGRLRFWLRMLA